MTKDKRTNKYDTHIKPAFERILGLLRSGYTEGSIAKSLGLSSETWIQYKKAYSEFSELIKKGGEDATALVVNKLYKRAEGYDYEETKTEIRDVDGKKTKVISKTTKHIPPDVGAIAIVLFNRDATKWQNKQKVEHTGSVDVPALKIILETPKE